MNILDTINSPSYIKNMSYTQLEFLAKEIREFLIDNIFITGGHLASNLGVVELTIAMHKVFDFKEDRLIFDVGHQSYVHKILTGRRNRFDTLRTLNGLSGFPKPEESIYDAFAAGHASTSISAAAGMARARDLQGKNHNVIAFVGDGALTGGMTFEAMNDIGENKSGMIIVLNDNEMSIEENVGGLSAHLGKLRYNKKYLNTKSAISGFLTKDGKWRKRTFSFLKSIKKKLKFATMAEPYFESLGINYIGIIDGHDIKSLCEIFERVKNTTEPVIIHTFTKKGLGYKEAEENPNKFHGVSRKCDDNATFEISNSTAFGNVLCEIGENNKNVIAITAAMSAGCGLTEFSKKFPKRFFDVGIAEEHAVTMAAGMASAGLVPVVCIYSTFMQRSYDQLIHDVCMQNLHVVFAIDRAGLVGEDGETHQGLFDLSFMSHVPNLTILTPSCHKELRQMLCYAINECDGPVAIRYPRGSIINRDCMDFSISEPEIISDGGNVCIVACGNMVETAIKCQQNLKGKNIETTVINLSTVKPLNLSFLEKHLKDKYVVTIEDNLINGGMGTFLQSNINHKLYLGFLKFGFPDKFIKQGTQEEIFDIYGLTDEKISQQIEREFFSNELKT